MSQIAKNNFLFLTYLILCIFFTSVDSSLLMETTCEDTAPYYSYYASLCKDTQYVPAMKEECKKTCNYCVEEVVTPPPVVQVSPPEPKPVTPARSSKYLDLFQLQLQQLQVLALI